jgi:hypothetical protein
MPGPDLDLILHSPGGSPEAAASLVRYMRSKYEHVRVFVPVAAMSAATMWALAADEIVMGKHSQLGPIDPQILLPQGVMVPANALLRQFKRASDECAADASKLSGWLPILQQFYPGLLEICEDADVLGRSLVAQWLDQYMFHASEDAEKKAQETADFFGSNSVHRSHGIGIDREMARQYNVNVSNLEEDPQLQDLILSVHHAALITMQGPAVKLIENQLGRRYFRLAQQIAVQVPTAILPLPKPAPPSVAS